MFVETDTGNELMLQNYDAYDAGEEIGMRIKPFDIQVMKKERTCNVFRGEMTASDEVEILGGRFSCADTGLDTGTSVEVKVDFSKIDIMDNQEEGVLEGEVQFILYKGNHYHITVKTYDGDFVYADTDDVWDKGDMVGINIKSEDLIITPAHDED